MSVTSFLGSHAVMTGRFSQTHDVVQSVALHNLTTVTFTSVTQPPLVKNTNSCMMLLQLHRLCSKKYGCLNDEYARTEESSHRLF